MYNILIAWRNKMKIKYFLPVSLFLILLSAYSFAADVNVILDSNDGSSALVVKDNAFNSPFNFDSKGGILSTGSVGSGRSYNLSATTGFLWYPKKSALRAGTTYGTEWNDGNIGNNSVVLGQASSASGANGVALGYSNTVGGINSTAIGHVVNAGGSGSIAIGEYVSTGGPGNNMVLGKGQDGSHLLTNNYPNSLAIGFGGTSPILFVSGEAVSGRIGVGTTSPGSRLAVKQSDSNYGGGFSLEMPGDANKWYVYQNSGYGLSINQNGGDKVTIANAGNVGIGTTSPGAKLSVVTSSGGGAEIGNNNSATGNYSLAAGYGTAATNSYSISMGHYTTSSSTSAIAMGEGATAAGSGAVSLGSVTQALAYSAVALGGGSIARGNSSVAMGEDCNATARAATAMGGETKATGQFSTAMGSSTTAEGLNSTAMGENCIATARASTAMGGSTKATGQYSTAMGSSTIAEGLDAIAMGRQTLAHGGWSTAMGLGTTANGNTSTAIGQNIIVSGDNSIGFGLDSTVRTVSAPNVMAILGGNVGIGTTSPSVKLDIAGDMRITDKDIYFRGDTYHGLGWYGTSKLFAGVNVDGPVLYGNYGGALGTTYGAPTQNIVLFWDHFSNVGIGTTSPTTKLEVNGNVKVGYGTFYPRYWHSSTWRV